MKKILFIAAMFLSMGIASAQEQGQEKEALFVENFTNSTSLADTYVNNLRNEVVNGIVATRRLMVADATVSTSLPTDKKERLAALNEKQIYYMLEGKLNSVTEKTRQNSDKTETYYGAEVNYTLTLIDTYSGEILASETYKDSYSSGDTREMAITKAVEDAKGHMKKFVDNHFKVEAKIKSLGTERDKKNNAKTVFVSIGSAMGISKGQIFEVFQDVEVAGEKVRKKVAELKAKEVLSATLTECTIKNGADVITKSFEEGIDMYIVSRATTDVFDKMDKILGI